MKAFHGDPAIKEKYLARVRAHRAADELERGYYWNAATHRGCAVGCTVETSSSAHFVFESELGIPRSLVYLEDTLFEGMPWKDALDLPERFLNSIKVGADLEHIADQLILWMLIDKKDGLAVIANVIVRDAIDKLVYKINRKIDGEHVPLSEWESVSDFVYLMNLPTAPDKTSSTILKIVNFYAYDDVSLMSAVLSFAVAIGEEKARYISIPEMLNKVANKLIQLLEAAPGDTDVNMLTEKEEEFTSVTYFPESGITVAIGESRPYNPANWTLVKE